LPRVRCSLEPERIVASLERAAKGGRLPEFVAGGDGGLFSAAAFGQYYDKRLVAEVEQQGSDTVLRFRTIWLLRMPVIVTIILLATVEPGRYLLDQLIPGQWGWIDTRWWYYPMTILPLPWMWWKVFKVSAQTTREHAIEMIGKIAKELGGSVVSGEQPTD
jgi:hypothetical protein